MKLPFKVGIAPGVYTDDSSFNKIGVYFCKTITLEPRKRMYMNTIVPVEGGFVNRVGLENVGLKEFVNKEIRHYQTYGVPVIVSLFSNNLGELMDMVVAMDSQPLDFIYGYELNLFCPNMYQHGFTTPESGYQALEALRRATERPIGIKLPADLKKARELAEACSMGRAGWMTICNTLQGTTVHPEYGIVTARISGNPLKHIAMSCINEILIDMPYCPIIACGGIETLQDIKDYKTLGADAFLVCSAEMTSPGTTAKLNKEYADCNF